MGIERAWVRVLTRCIAPLVAATTMGAAQAATPV
jgi:hypothetical protein